MSIDYSAQKISGETFLERPVAHNELPKGIYKYVPASQMKPEHLIDCNDFEMPSKIYGANPKRLTSKILNSFHKLNKNVGVLLSGLKGTGKSMQLKHIALNCGMPSIIVDEPIPGQTLINFSEKLGKPCCFLFDEFEKVYRRKEDQETVLPFLDGLSTRKNIFVMTINEQVSEYLINRPSRIRYHVKYSRLSDEIITELVNDLVEDDSKKEEIIGFFSIFNEISIDSLISFIQDVNLYQDSSVSEIAREFNLDDPADIEYDFTFESEFLHKKDVVIPEEIIAEVNVKTSIVGSIFNAEEGIESYIKETISDIAEQYSDYYTIGPCYAEASYSINDIREEPDIYLTKPRFKNGSMTDSCIYTNYGYLSLDKRLLDFRFEDKKLGMYYNGRKIAVGKPFRPVSKFAF